MLKCGRFWPWKPHWATLLEGVNLTDRGLYMPYWKWTTKVSITPCTEVSQVRLFFFSWHLKLVYSSRDQVITFCLFRLVLVLFWNLNCFYHFNCSMKSIWHLICCWFCFGEMNWLSQKISGKITSKNNLCLSIYGAWGGKEKEASPNCVLSFCLYFM